MDLCGACGAFAQPDARTCGVCESPLDRRTVRGGLPEGSSLVGLRCRFQCRGCGHMAPLDGLDLDGTVRCARCGLEQAFDVDSWTEGLGFAHDVADLCGPEPEGRSRHADLSISAENPYRELGLYRVWATHALSGEVRQGASVLQRSLELRVHPGRPLCTCGEPLSLTVSGERVDARCTRCGQTREGRLPVLARRLYAPVRALFAGPGPQISTTRGLTGSGGYSCPGCGAPLPVTGMEPVVTCSFCKLATRIASFSGLADDRPPAVFWLAFQGPSAERRRLLREGGALDGDPGAVADPPEGSPEGPALTARLLLRWGFPLGAFVLAGLIVFGVLLALR